MNDFLYNHAHIILTKLRKQLHFLLCHYIRELPFPQLSSTTNTVVQKTHIESPFHHFYSSTMAKQSAGILCLILITFAAVPSWATDYTVGDSSGWALGVDYTSWPGGKTFNVGDNLVFKYQSSHTVDEVTQSDYSTCTVGNSISSDNTGSTTIPLKTPGTHYFICGVVGHCGGGMKLSVTVQGGGPAASPPTGSGTTTSPPSGTTTTPATPTTTLTPPSSTTTVTEPSSSATLTPFGALFFTLVALISKLFMS